MRSPRFRKLLCSVLHLNPWTCIAFIYGMHTLGALLVIRRLNLPWSPMLGPLLILAFGMGTAVALRWLDRSGRLHAWKWWVPALIYAFFIFSMSNQSFPAVKVSVNVNWFHPLEYMILGLFLCLVWYKTLQGKGVYPFSARVLSMGILYGLSDELHQSFIPGRDPSGIDLSLDLLGLTAACVLFILTVYAHRTLKKRLMP